jgi:cell division protein ZapA
MKKIAKFPQPVRVRYPQKRKPCQTQQIGGKWGVQQGAYCMSNRVKVEIYGQSYTMAGDLDEAYVQKLARYVDEKMSAVAAATQTVDSVRVAVLAAMAIADELHTLRQEKGDRDENLRERAEQCLTILERALKQTA